MGILKVSPRNPIEQKQTARHYNPKKWDEQSENLRGKPWAEVFDLIQKQFKNERLDMKKLKDLLGRLSPNTNWSKVLNELTEFFEKYENERLKRKKYRGYEYSYSEADELRFQRKQLLNALRMRVNVQKEQALAMEEEFDSKSDVVFEDPESDLDLEEKEKQFDDIETGEFTRIQDSRYYSPTDRSQKRYNSGSKIISLKRGARARRKDERRYF